MRRTAEDANEARRMTPPREDLVRIVRDTISTSECDNPITFDPPEWAIRAMQRAYERGVRDGRRLEHEDTVAAVLT